MSFWAGDVFERGAGAMSCYAVGADTYAKGLGTHAEGYNAVCVNSAIDCLDEVMRCVKEPIVKGIAHLRRKDLKTLR